MTLELEDKEIIFIYGHFKKQICKLEEMKSSPDCPIEKSCIKKDINFYNKITESIAKQYPQLIQMNKYI